MDQVAPSADVFDIGSLGLGVETYFAHQVILRDRRGGDYKCCEAEDQRACEKAQKSGEKDVEDFWK